MQTCLQDALPVLPSRRFERPAQPGLAAMGIDEFAGAQIDAYGARKSTAAANGGASTADAPPPPPPPPGLNLALLHMPALPHACAVRAHA